MQSQGTNDTFSPWYEAFSPLAAPAGGQALVSAADPAAKPAALAEAEGAAKAAAEALFDCYNG